MTTLEHDLSVLLAQTNFDTELGIRLVAASPGECTLRVPCLRKLERPGGIVAGYILVAAADIAAWLALKTILGLEDGSLTADLHSAFLRAGRGEITCRARVLRCGRRLAWVGAACYDAAEHIVAQHTVTYARVP